MYFIIKQVLFNITLQVFFLPNCTHHNIKKYRNRKEGEKENLCQWLGRLQALIGNNNRHDSTQYDSYEKDYCESIIIGAVNTANFFMMIVGIIARFVLHL